MKLAYLSATVAAGALLAAGATQAFPAYGADTGPAVIITLNANNTATVTNTGQGPYDGVEDSYIGVVNNSGHSVSDLTLHSTLTIFGFDGDGLALYGAPSPNDPNGYGGPDGSFTIADAYNGAIHFANGIADGGTDYFSLEESVTAASFTGVTIGTPEPATWALMLIGVGGVGYSMRRRAAKALAV